MNAFFFLKSILLYFNEIYRNFSEQNPFPTLFPKTFELNESEKRTETKNLKRTKKNEAKNGKVFSLERSKRKRSHFASFCFEAKNFSKRNRRTQIHIRILFQVLQRLKNQYLFLLFTVLPVHTRCFINDADPTGVQ
jgi:hypothetical protein